MPESDNLLTGIHIQQEKTRSTGTKTTTKPLPHQQQQRSQQAGKDKSRIQLLYQIKKSTSILPRQVI
jgi:hypothetical protein